MRSSWRLPVDPGAHIHPIPVLIIGAGGHARELVEIFAARRRADLDVDIPIVGFLDDTPARHGTYCADVAPILGSVDQWLRGELDAQMPYAGRVQLLCAIGSPTVRAKVVRFIEAQRPDADWLDRLIHPTAVVTARVTAGPGLVLFPHTCISVDVTLGAHVHCNVGSSASHDTVLGDFVTLSPGARVAGSVQVGEQTDIGMQASVIQQVRVGTQVRVGAGAVVVRDTPDTVTMVGVPARPLRPAGGGQAP